MAVNDTSMPPDTITISTPMAKMPMTMLLRIRSNMLPTVKKTGLLMPTIRHKPTMVTATKTSLLRNRRFTSSPLD